MTIWREDPPVDGRRQAINVMRAEGGLGAHGKTAFSHWRVFIDDLLLDIIVECTNAKARSLNVNFVPDQQELTTYMGVWVLNCVVVTWMKLVTSS